MTTELAPREQALLDNLEKALGPIPILLDPDDDAPALRNHAVAHCAADLCMCCNLCVYVCNGRLEGHDELTTDSLYLMSTPSFRCHRSVSDFSFSSVEGQATLMALSFTCLCEKISKAK